MIEIKRHQRIDWFSVIIDLHRAGHSFASISRQVDIPASTLKSWKLQHSRPKFEEALRVIEFWCVKTGSAPADIHVVDRYA